MELNTNTVLQVAILATGMYLFLRFLRTTRGGGVLRGLTVAFAIGAVGLWGLVEYFGLEELRYIIQGVTPYLAVILAILFQPELRRAIARLGEHDRLARFLGTRPHGTVHEVVQAALDMAGRRHGALIAFQRESSLDAYTQTAVKIDAEVRRLLLESIFHPGSSLHDGGVVIHDDRVVAAACIFPLTENTDLSKSTGTRHRAGIGLTEESDAVTLIVSEETGSIAICSRGQMDRHVPADRVESVLLERLGYHTDEVERRRLKDGLLHGARILRNLFTHDLLRKAASIALASILVMTAHSDITIEDQFDLTVVSSGPGRSRQAQEQQLLIRLPGEDYFLTSPKPGDVLQVWVRGTRAELERVSAGLRGLITIPANFPSGSELPLENVVWSAGTPQELDLTVTWATEERPRIKIERFAQFTISSLEAEHLSIDDEDLDDRLQVLTDADQIEFDPKALEIRGPKAAIEALERGEIPFRLQRIVLRPEDRRDRSYRLNLSAELREQGLEIAGGQPVGVTLKIIPAQWILGTIEEEIEVIQDPTRVTGDEVERWKVSELHLIARLRVDTAGIIPATAEPGQQTFTEISNTIRAYVKNELDVVARVRDMVDGQGDVEVGILWPPQNWREELSDALGTKLHEFARLDVVLLSDERVRLIRSDDG